MKYTFSEEADKKIDKDIKIIIEELKKRIPGILSIILTGGFSRGEGPVKKLNGKWYPYNDYDIQVIAKKEIHKENIDKISVDISKKLGYGGIENFYPFKKEKQKMKSNFYIDLKSDTLSGLKNLLPRIRTYELKNHSRILWGEDLRDLIPDYKLGDIPLGEGAKLLIDRMSQLVEYYSTEKKYEKENLTYFIQQAYAAICTSLLLLNKRYQIGYKRSMNILKENYKRNFPELYKKIPDLHLKIEQFINWKSNPSNLPNENVEEEWFIVRKSIIEVSKYFFSRFLKRRINTIDELSRAILNMEKQFYLPFLNIIIKNKFSINAEKFSFLLIPFVKIIFKKKYNRRLKDIYGFAYPKIYLSKSPDLIIGASVVYLLGSVSEKGVDKKMIIKFKELLGKVYPCKGRNWEELTLDYANAYIAFYMQKL